MTARQKRFDQVEGKMREKTDDREGNEEKREGGKKDREKNKKDIYNIIFLLIIIKKAKE